MNLTFIDTETTGIKEEDVIIQLGLINEVDGEVKHQIDSYFCNGGVKISLISKATHGIVEEDIADFPVFGPKVPEYELLQELVRDSVFIGHNVQFDIGMLSKSGIKISTFIDTLQIARHLMQDKEEEFETSYRQEVLKYYLMEKGIVFPNVKAHDAMSDVLVMRVIFEYLFNLTREKFVLSTDEDIIKKMITQSSTPILITKINFGKYKGSTFEQIARNDPNYLDWLARTSEDENVKFTCSRWRKN